jgi:hypothetical protein
MTLNITSLLAEMRADPESFLRHYWLQIAGGATATGIVSGHATDLATFQFDDKLKAGDGFTTGISGVFGLKKKRPWIKFTKRKIPAVPNPDPNKGEFNAWYVPMQADDASGFGGGYQTLPPTGVDIMLTSQLSGCTFAQGFSGGSTIVSHIQPYDSSSTARTHLHQTSTNLYGGTPNSLFERENQSTSSYGSLKNRATIIGVRTGMVWEFYSQTFTAGGDAVIKNVKKL